MSIFFINVLDSELNKNKRFLFPLIFIFIIYYILGVFIYDYFSTSKILQHKLNIIKLKTIYNKNDKIHVVRFYW